MRAAYIDRHGDIDQIQIGTLPTPEPGAGQVRVKVKACGLNHLDLFVLRGMPGLPVEMPRIPGGDIAGDVESVGRGVEGIAIGTPVLIDPEIGRGIDTHLNRNFVLGEHLNGGLCEYVVVPAENLIPLPDGVTYDQAACIPIAYGTAWRMMVRRGQIAPYEHLLVLGASGGVGTACVQIGAMAGATVTAAASSNAKLDQLKALGATHGINYRDEDFSRRAWEIADKRGMDVIVNFTGGDTWTPSIRAMRVNGRLLTCGASAGFDPPTDLRYVWRREINILGCNSWSREDLEVMLDLVRHGRIVPPVHAIHDLDHTQEAFRALRDREVLGKVLVHP